CESLLSHVVDESEKKNTRDPRVGCSPSEPVERARHQFGINDFFCGPIDLGLKRSVDHVKEVEVSDPDDSSADVQPPEDCFQSLHDSSEDNGVMIPRRRRYHNNTLGV